MATYLFSAVTLALFLLIAYVLYRLEKLTRIVVAKKTKIKEVKKLKEVNFRNIKIIENEDSKDGKWTILPKKNVFPKKSYAQRILERKVTDLPEVARKMFYEGSNLNELLEYEKNQPRN